MKTLIERANYFFNEDEQLDEGWVKDTIKTIARKFLNLDPNSEETRRSRRADVLMFTLATLSALGINGVKQNADEITQALIQNTHVGVPSDKYSSTEEERQVYKDGLIRQYKEGLEQFEERKDKFTEHDKKQYMEAWKVLLDTLNSEESLRDLKQGSERYQKVEYGKQMYDL